MQQKILDAINDFLHEKNIKPVELNDRLHSSGILSSLGMFELVLNLEQRGWRMPRGAGLNLPMEEIDLVFNLCECEEKI